MKLMKKINQGLCAYRSCVFLNLFVRCVVAKLLEFIDDTCATLTNIKKRSKYS